MKVDKLSISLEGGLGEEVRDAARKAGQTVSAWLAEAARARLRHDGLKEYLDDYEREFGAFTEEELEQARRELYPERYAAEQHPSTSGRRVAE